MTFHAVLGQRTIKSFTKCLTCLSRYGDDVIMVATADALSLIATNSSKSAFCRITLRSQYFEKYKFNIGTPPGLSFQTPADPGSHEIISQLLVKSLLSILKHKTVEKSVDRCELSIIEKDQDRNTSVDSEEDSLESKLIVRLHCKHAHPQHLRVKKFLTLIRISIGVPSLGRRGLPPQSVLQLSHLEHYVGVIKTHRLLLLDSPGPLTPVMASSPSESRVAVGPRALKDILDHFPHVKGTKSDPQLIWLFAMNDVKVKSQEGNSDVKSGKSQISTEISISADEFDSYNICDPPVSLAFHLREFNATILLAESLSVALDMRFTEPTEPIYITFDTNDSESEYLFVISTTQTVYDSSLSSKAPGAARLRKRDRENDRELDPGNSQAMVGRPAKKKSLPVAIEQSPSFTNAQPERSPSQQHVMPNYTTSVQNNDSSGDVTISDAPERKSNSTPLFMPGASQVSNVALPLEGEASGPGPLFMPGASQLSQADMDILRLSGLGIEHMAYDEFEAMMDAEGEEVGMSTGVGDILDHRQGVGGQTEVAESDMDDDVQWPSTQVPVERKGNKVFRPLFDD